MNNKTIILVLTLLISTSNFLAQEVKFGKVSKKELEEKFYPQDTSANAVVLYKKHRTYYVYNQSMGWMLKTEIHERIKLYNKDGFEYATKKVRLYDSNSGDELFSIKAYTYNLENGKIEKTKLEKSVIFNEKINKNLKGKNFTLPNLKEGSIIEWKYSISSPYFAYIDDVICQYNIPIKYLDIRIKIPEIFQFKYLSSRYYPIEVNITSETFNASISEKVYTAKINEIPALIKEPYVNNFDDYRAKLDFEISAYRPVNGVPKFYNSTWKDVTKTIYDSPRFGSELNKSNHFKNDLIEVTNGLTTREEKILSVFEFVKNKIKWNENYSKYVSSDGIKSAYKEGIGNVAEINLTLVAMLREAGINANPILVSTRDNGIPIFPTSEGYNYVIAGIENQDDIMLLDATEKYSLPNVLPLRVLNWEGRLIRENGSSINVNLYPNKYNTKQVILTGILDKEGSFSGMMRTNYHNLNALKYRDDNNSITEDELISKIETKNKGIEIEKFRLNNKANISKPLIELIKFDAENQVDIIGNKTYLSPLLFLTVNENPFKLEERLYPIDYGSPWKNKLNISIQIPENYAVESKPQDLSLELPNNMGSYSMTIKVNKNNIQVNSTTSINRALIGSNEYPSLKEFYKQAIDRQLEKIVLVPVPTQP